MKKKIQIESEFCLTFVMIFTTPTTYEWTKNIATFSQTFLWTYKESKKNIDSFQLALFAVYVCVIPGQIANLILSPWFLITHYLLALKQCFVVDSKFLHHILSMFYNASNIFILQKGEKDNVHTTECFFSFCSRKSEIVSCVEKKQNSPSLFSLLFANAVVEEVVRHNNNNNNNNNSKAGHMVLVEELLLLLLLLLLLFFCASNVIICRARCWCCCVLMTDF